MKFNQPVSKPRYKGAASRSAPEAPSTVDIEVLMDVWQYDDNMGIRDDPMKDNSNARVPELERAPASQRGDN